MATVSTQINDHAASVNVLNTLALELERAEFDGNPELAASMGAYTRAKRAALGNLGAMADYRGPDLSKNPVKQIRDAEAELKTLRCEVHRRECLRKDGYCDGGLRRLIDARLFAELAARDVWWLKREYQIRKQRRKNERRRLSQERSKQIGREFFAALKESLSPHGAH